MTKDIIEKKLKQIRAAVVDIENMLQDKSLFPAPMSLAMATGTASDFEGMKKLLFSDEWPKAVADELICDTNNEEHKMSRANGIVDVLVSEPVHEKMVLDFGTGYGHVVKACAMRKAKFSVGYDIHNDFANIQDKNTLLTTNWRDVQERAPYDIIIACDVMDHLENMQQVDALNNMRTILAPQGKIFVRYHSFMSRHHAHLYKKLNKAFIHLIFNEQELKELFPDEKISFPQKVFFPIKTYTENAAGAGLKIENEFKITSEVEQFFERNEIMAKISQNTPFKAFPKAQMQMDFIDYIYTV